MPDAQCHSTILSHLLKAYSPLAIAFSGGLDSRFLAFMAKRLQPEGVAAHLYFFHGPHQSARETAEAENWARQMDLPITILHLNPLEHPNVCLNEPDRCYHCKRLLFLALQQAIAENPPFPGQATTLCDGSNTSDQQGYRPGQRALKELSVHSPLAEAGLGKEDIRRIGAELGLDKPEQHARPCLLTRYKYGIAADAESLEALGRAEDAVLALLEEAADAQRISLIPDFRLRLTNAPQNSKSLAGYLTELHISGPMPTEDICEALQKAVMTEGFTSPEIKAMESISGYYDNRNGNSQ